MSELVGLAALVTPNMVRAHLVGRDVRILRTIDQSHEQFLDFVRGVSLEVEAVVGRDLDDGEKRRMAVWAITFGVAAHLESALFPEQQLGDDGRADWLMQRYLGLLSALRNLSDTGTDTGGVPSPTGYYPPAEAYPDPAVVVPASRYWTGW